LLQLLGSLGTFSALIAAVITFYIFQAAQDSERKLQLEIEADRLGHSVLQSYLQDMKGLLIDTDLADPGDDSTVREIARALTITVVRQLDGVRKGILLKFLYDTNLITDSANQITLLSEVDLNSTVLRDADLSGAILSDANLSEANLSLADLSDADLSGADLSDADLSGADLSRADLTGADLSRADLTGARLDDATIKSNFGLTRAQLDQALPIPETPIPTPETPGPTLETPGSTPTSATGDCFKTFFQEIPADRVSPVAVGVRDFDIIRPQQKKQGIFGIKFTDVGQPSVQFEILPIGGIIIFSNPENSIFGVVSVVDGRCVPIEEYSNVSRGGDKNTLQNYDVLEIRFGNDVYNLRIGLGETGIGVNHFIKVN